MQWVSHSCKVMVSPELLTIGKGEQKLALFQTGDAGIEVGEPGNPIDF